MAERVVTGPVVVLPDGNGLIRYYYQGAVLPEGLDEERVQSAIADGLVSEDKSAGELTVDDLDVSAAGDRLRSVSTSDTGTAATGDGDGDGPPAKAAPKEAWVDYAVDQERAGSGDDFDEAAARAEAESLTKAELIDKYGA